MKNFSIFFLVIILCSNAFGTRSRRHQYEAGSSAQALADYQQALVPRRSPSPSSIRDGVGESRPATKSLGVLASQTPNQFDAHPPLLPRRMGDDFDPSRDSDPDRCKRLCCFCAAATLWYSAVAYLGWSEGYGDWPKIKMALTLLEPLVPGSGHSAPSHP